MIADWTVAFNLTSALYSASVLPINQTLATGGIYILRPEGCKLTNQVRATKNDVPQADGAILHRRFVAGMEISLAIQLWQSRDAYACDDLAQSMLDDLMGYLYQLINAGDNEGRISWAPAGVNVRMLDDIRLLTYPEVSQVNNAGVEVLVTLDTVYPYEEDLTQTSTAMGASTALVNSGNRPTYPVIKLDGPITTVTMANTSTGEQWEYDSGQPGASAIGLGHYIEIDTFRNTVYLDGSGANRKAGVVATSSEFFTLVPGSNTVTLTGGVTGTALINAAWA